MPLLVTQGVAYLTELEGLSMALGAFVAGMLLSGNRIPHSGGRRHPSIPRYPVGLLLHYRRYEARYSGADRQLAANPDFVGNPVDLESTGRLHHRFAHEKPCGRQPQECALFGARWRVRLRNAGYFQQNQYGFASELEQAATAAVLLSMIAAPFILGSSDAIVSRFVKSDWDMKALDLHSMLVETMSKSEHVLIIGFDAAVNRSPVYWRKKAAPYFALDLTLPAYKWHATQANRFPLAMPNAVKSWKLAGLGRAKMVVITLEQYARDQHVLGNIMSMHPSMPASCSSHQ